MPDTLRIHTWPMQPNSQVYCSVSAFTNCAPLCWYWYNGSQFWAVCPNFSWLKHTRALHCWGYLFELGNGWVRMGQLACVHVVSSHVIAWRMEISSCGSRKRWSVTTLGTTRGSAETVYGTSIPPAAQMYARLRAGGSQLSQPNKTTKRDHHCI